MRASTVKRTPKGWGRRFAVPADRYVGRWFAGLVGCCVIGFGAWLSLAPDVGDATRAGPTGEIARDDEAPREAVVKAVIARIAAEGRGDLPPPTIVAAPRRYSDTGPVVPESAAALRSPPDGYGFVEYHGSRPTERFERRGTPAAPPAPREDLEWLGSVGSVADVATLAQSTGRDWSFGWIRLRPDSRLADAAPSLEALGVVVEGSAGALVRARLPGDRARLHAIAALPEVDGLGAVPPEGKLPPSFADEILSQSGDQPTPVFVTLMADDPDGRWKRQLERLGAVVGAYDRDVRAYEANIPHGALQAVAAADFVSAIEPVGIVEAAHDTAVPAMGADALRAYGGSPGSFSGTAGSNVPVAVMDTGLNINHLDIVSNRDSVCGANFAYSRQQDEDQDLWVDAHGHGTHVTGTLAGTGIYVPGYAGMAPSVRHIRFAKVLNSFGYGPYGGVRRGMDFLAEPTACPGAGWSTDPVKPLIVNMSLGESGPVHEGRDFGARKLDAVVWQYRQLYVVAQANSGISGFSNFGAAKNSLSVGAVFDSGEVAWFSSVGPTADGRLAPLVVGTGVDLWSPNGGGARGGYEVLSGTSMASPAVAGVAALLMDAVPAHREQPALTRARLMASAVKPDAWLESPGAFPADNSLGPGTLNDRYGLGKVSAHTTVLNRDQPDGWTSGSFTADLADGQYAYRDIVVPEGASRLDLVLTWDEPPADVIASPVLNDLDLWLDRDADCDTAQCGEYSSESRIDNVEWIVVRNPAPGTWRVKAVAHVVYTDAPRAALAWTVIRGGATPELSMVAESDADNEGEITITVAADGYVATGTRLQVQCRTVADNSPCPAPAGGERMRYEVVRQDGLVTEGDTGAGGLIPLGEVAAGESRVVKFNNIPYPAGVRLHFAATAWNATAGAASVLLGNGADNASPQDDRPSNDAFLSAEAIEGGQGSRPVDLLWATTEPGEPVSTEQSARPGGSVWYRWKATAAGPIHFDVLLEPAFEPEFLGSPGSDPDIGVRLDVFRGDTIAGLRRIASTPGGASLIAQRNHDYAVRVSSTHEASRLTLAWRKGPRPENDRFDAAVALSGAEGGTNGSNTGATLEQGEFFGPFAATVWYVWTAPSDGDWAFRSSIGQLRLLVFTGGAIGDLRLVSGVPSSAARFGAAAGETYRIAVAARDAFAAGREFELTWEPVVRYPANDDFEDADELPGMDSSSVYGYIAGDPTVEPGEPPEAGVRTRWWSWTAPATGDYTWGLGSPTAGLILTAFAGESLEDLQLIGTTATGVATGVSRLGFVFAATEGETYRLALGILSGHPSVFTHFSLNGTIYWGPTPSNDGLSEAAVLSDAGGAEGGNNRYATIQPREWMWDVGHSSLWWNFETPAAGWYRFWLDETSPFTLAAFSRAIGSSDRLEMIASSRRGLQSGTVEVVFYAEADDRFAIRLGTYGLFDGGNFTMRWAETEAPMWLRFAGSLDLDGDEVPNDPVDIRGAGRMTFDASGRALYLASETGLHVFRREPTTGALAHEQSFEGNLGEAAILWDRHRSRLLVFDGCDGRSYPAVDGTFRRLRDGGALSLPECTGDARWFASPDGSFLYHVYGALRVYSFESDSALRLVQDHNLYHYDAVISRDGGHVYAVEYSSLVALERNAVTGELTETSRMSIFRGRTLSIGHDGGHLFAFDDAGLQTNVYDLEDPSNPVWLDTLTRFGVEYPSTVTPACDFSVARNRGSAADVFCISSAYTVNWQSATGQLAAADHVANWRPDRFNNHVPKFGEPRDMAASPEGRHVYVSTDGHGILLFERVGNEIVDTGGGAEDGYVPLSVLGVSVGTIRFGPLSSESCIGINDLAIDDIHYDVEVSNWQTRADTGASWSDIDGTEAMGQICPHTPSETGHYRLVVDMEIDGEAGRYASNSFTYDAG